MPDPKVVRRIGFSLLVVGIPTLVFFRLYDLGTVGNALVVGAVCGIIFGYKAWYEQHIKKS